MLTGASRTVGHVGWQQLSHDAQLLILFHPIVLSINMSRCDSPHLLLGRIRFLNRCIESFRKSELLPKSLCYVPREVCYKICKDSSSTSSSSATASAGGPKTLVSVFDSPHQVPHSKRTCKYNVEPKKGTCIRTTGEEYCNSQGLWVKLNKVKHLP